MVYYGYDFEALSDANKGLSICFIIAITIANGILIYQKIKKGSLLYTPRSLILTSLAIGDIVYALFVLAIFARELFDVYGFTPYCSTLKAFTTYRNFLLHFVFGVGLVILVFEFHQRNRTPQPTGNTSNNLVKSIIYSACPWILGLIIILPLTMADGYVKSRSSDFCSPNFTPLRINVMFAVSVILPAILSVLASIAIMSVKLSPPDQLSPVAVTYQGSSPGVVISSQNINVGNVAGPPQYPGGSTVSAPYYPNTSTQGPQVYLSNGQPVTSQIPVASVSDKPDSQMFSTPNVQYPVQQYPVQQFPAQQYPVQQYPGQQYPPTQYLVQYPPPQFLAQQYTTQSNVILTAPTNVVYQQNTTAPPNSKKEKIALLVAAIAFFVCVVPYAAFIIDNENIAPADLNWFRVTQNSLFWLSVARSLITPIIFIIVN